MSQPIMANMGFIPLDTQPESPVSVENKPILGRQAQKIIGITLIALGIIAFIGVFPFSFGLAPTNLSLGAILASAFSYALLMAGLHVIGGVLLANACPYKRVGDQNSIDDQTRFDYAHAVLKGSLANLAKIYDKAKMVGNGFLYVAENADEISEPDELIGPLVEAYKKAQAERETIETTHQPNFKAVKDRVANAESFESYLDNYVSLPKATEYQLAADKMAELEKSWTELQCILKLREQNADFIAKLK